MTVTPAQEIEILRVSSATNHLLFVYRTKLWLIKYSYVNCNAIVFMTPELTRSVSISCTGVTITCIENHIGVAYSVYLFLLGYISLWPLAAYLGSSLSFCHIFLYIWKYVVHYTFKISIWLYIIAYSYTLFGLVVFVFVSCSKMQN